MTDREYILAGNYQLLDALYRRLAKAERQNKELQDKIRDLEDLMKEATEWHQLK